MLAPSVTITSLCLLGLTPEVHTHLRTSCTGTQPPSESGHSTWLRPRVHTDQSSIWDTQTGAGARPRGQIRATSMALWALCFPARVTLGPPASDCCGWPLGLLSHRLWTGGLKVHGSKVRSLLVLSWASRAPAWHGAQGHRDTLSPGWSPSTWSVPSSWQIRGSGGLPVGSPAMMLLQAMAARGCGNHGLMTACVSIF